MLDIPLLYVNSILTEQAAASKWISKVQRYVICNNSNKS